MKLFVVGFVKKATEKCEQNNVEIQSKGGNSFVPIVDLVFMNNIDRNWLKDFFVFQLECFFSIVISIKTLLFLWRVLINLLMIVFTILVNLMSVKVMMNVIWVFIVWNLFIKYNQYCVYEYKESEYKPISN